jgi:hypothetical protein
MIVMFFVFVVLWWWRWCLFYGVADVPECTFVTAAQAQVEE